MLLPALMAGVGFFFGQTVTPLYFYVSVAILLVCAFVGGWKRGVAYVALLVVCTVLTMFTFSYVGGDTQAYHFPMQHLLRNGWNPVFDSTVEKFYPLLEGSQLWFYHALFLPKFQELCGAIVSSSFHLFAGDAFLGYLLVACLFTTCVRFGRRQWRASTLWCVLFACGMTFSKTMWQMVEGVHAYSCYSSFCISAMTLVLYRNERRFSDLVLFVVSASICMACKTTGVLCVGLLVLLTLPLLWRRAAYWRAFLALGFLVAVVGASPLLTNWIQYGSPFYPSMTFNPDVPVVDITCDFTGNADALGMGFLSRICYAWVSPKLTVAAIRLFGDSPGFNPVFTYYPVTGIGLWFNALLLVSVALLAISRKNLITWLCVIIFVSANFAPVKYIGSPRYFPQIWAIIPLSVMNFVCTARCAASETRMRTARKVVAVLLAGVLVGLAGMSLSRFLRYQGGLMVFEGVRQRLISSFPKEVKVDESFYRYTTVQRFRQAGITMVKATDGSADTVEGKRLVDPWGRLLQHMPYKDPVTSRVSLPPEGVKEFPDAKEPALLCTDPATGKAFEFYGPCEFECVDKDWCRDLFAKGKLRAIIDNFPHVLWD